MRAISWLTLGSALLCSNLAFAQDAPRPVQVIIGPNGVKVIDPCTGKELPSVVTRVPGAPPRIQIELDVDKKKSGVFEIDLQLEAAHKELLRVIQQKKGSKEDHKVEIHQIELKIGPDGKARVVALQGSRDKGPGAGLSTDKKIDLLLKEMSELRRDMNELKQKLSAGGGRPWGGPGGMWWMKGENKGKENVQERKEEKGKRTTGKEPEKKETPGRESDIERRFERILREAEELRRELRKRNERDKD